MAVGNKRQRLAKKAYLDKNEHLPKSAASEGGGLPPSSNALRKESRTDSSASRNKNKFGETRKPPTHPLRVPGMRPGEACFLCKGTGHIAKNCPQKEGSDRKKMCLSCRCWGHTLKTCPSAPPGKSCYNCGQDGHRLSECPEPRVDDGTAHAVCFVCHLKGHLSRNCPSNPNGCYPKGGCCKLCGGVTHLAKDCVTPRGGGGGGAKLRTISWEAAPVSAPGSAKGRIIFESGDDLEDDFERSEGPGERRGDRDHDSLREEGDRDSTEKREVTDARNSEREMMSTDSHTVLTKARSIRF